MFATATSAPGGTVCLALLRPLRHAPSGRGGSDTRVGADEHVCRPAVELEPRTVRPARRRGPLAGEVAGRHDPMGAEPKIASDRGHADVRTPGGTVCLACRRPLRHAPFRL